MKLKKDNGTLISFQEAQENLKHRKEASNTDFIFYKNSCNWTWKDLLEGKYNYVLSTYCAHVYYGIEDYFAEYSTISVKSIPNNKLAKALFVKIKSGRYLADIHIKDKIVIKLKRKIDKLYTLLNKKSVEKFNNYILRKNKKI